MRLDFSMLTSPMPNTRGRVGTTGTPSIHAGFHCPHDAGINGDIVGQDDDAPSNLLIDGAFLHPLSPDLKAARGQHKPSIGAAAPTVPSVPTSMTTTGNATAKTTLDVVPDAWEWPHGLAMNADEIDKFQRRVVQFIRMDVNVDHAEHLADKLTKRDRDGDYRRLCLECTHYAAGLCLTPTTTGLNGTVDVRAIHLKLQHCPGFEDAADAQVEGTPDDSVLLDYD